MVEIHGERQTDPYVFAYIGEFVMKVGLLHIVVRFALEG
jgi:hypothetical protein